MLPARPGPAVRAPSPAGEAGRFHHPRGVVADRRGVAPAATAVHLPAVSGDRRHVVPVAAHRQNTGALDLPEAGGLHQEPGRHPGPGPRSARGITARSRLGVRLFCAQQVDHGAASSKFALPRPTGMACTLMRCLPRPSTQIICRCECVEKASQCDGRAYSVGLRRPRAACAPLHDGRRIRANGPAIYVSMLWCHH